MLMPVAGVSVELTTQIMEELLMGGLNQWLVEINKNNHVLFAVVTVITMSGMGVIIAATIEFLFKLLGIKGERIEIQH